MAAADCQQAPGLLLTQQCFLNSTRSAVWLSRVEQAEDRLPSLLTFLDEHTSTLFESHDEYLRAGSISQMDVLRIMLAMRTAGCELKATYFTESPPTTPEHTGPEATVLLRKFVYELPAIEPEQWDSPMFQAAHKTTSRKSMKKKIKLGGGGKASAAKPTVAAITEDEPTDAALGDADPSAEMFMMNPVLNLRPGPSEAEPAPGAAAEAAKTVESATEDTTAGGEAGGEADAPGVSAPARAGRGERSPPPAALSGAASGLSFLNDLDEMRSGAAENMSRRKDKLVGGSTRRGSYFGYGGDDFGAGRATNNPVFDSTMFKNSSSKHHRTAAKPTAKPASSSSLAAKSTSSATNPAPSAASSSSSSSSRSGAKSRSNRHQPASSSSSSSSSSSGGSGSHRHRKPPASSALSTSSGLSFLSEMQEMQQQAAESRPQHSDRDANSRLFDQASDQSARGGVRRLPDKPVQFDRNLFDRSNAKRKPRPH